ncbi:hypothetical protein [uncultured Flavonifractor sp.]|uniref:hypothetical protein n=1 Tax=uncultured Flavonifractor sp. TaxID=1193534 RepID=UPI0026317138|nr:hypothetical protein [uncultured Flavonifractor sp.]
MKDPKAAGLLGDKALLQSILNAPDTQRLMQLLNQAADGGLKQAAGAAAKGDTQALAGLVKQVLASREGARLAEQLNRTISQGR